VIVAVRPATTMLAVRVCVDSLAANVNATSPSPLPLCLLSNTTLLSAVSAVQSHTDGLAITIRPEPPAAENVFGDASTLVAQSDVGSCTIVTTCPATDTEPVRSRPGFGATSTTRSPSPVPEAGLICRNASDDAAFQAHSAAPLMETDARSPRDLATIFEGLTTNEHPCATSDAR
jgi:hypothetical protein